MKKVTWIDKKAEHFYNQGKAQTLAETEKAFGDLQDDLYNMEKMKFISTKDRINLSRLLIDKFQELKAKLEQTK